MNSRIKSALKVSRLLAVTGVSAGLLFSGAANAEALKLSLLQGKPLLTGGPLAVQIGNGAPLISSSTAKVGVGVLSTASTGGSDVRLHVVSPNSTAVLKLQSLVDSKGHSTGLFVNTPLDGLLTK